MIDVNDILILNDLWEKASSDIIADNIKDLLFENGYDTFVSRVEKLQDITNSTYHAVFAWLNHGRKTKIPFLKLCMIAAEFNVNIVQLMSNNEN